MSDVVIVEAVRTPLGRRNGGLSTMHSVNLLGAVQRELFVRSGFDPGEVGQVTGRERCAPSETSRRATKLQRPPP